MKKYLLALVSGCILFFSAFSQPFPHFPVITPAGKGKVDTRIDCFAYWKKMVKLGYVKPSPYVPVPKAVFTSSKISGKDISTQDSPDIPITEDSNTTQSENSVFIDPFDESILLNQTIPRIGQVEMLKMFTVPTDFHQLTKA